MARYCHDPLVVPALPHFSGHKGMAQVMEMYVLLIRLWYMPFSTTASSPAC